ncbi:hypothetical protein YTPLAS18_06420 [Nitrospira sp.]|nr:hypothetical protein YTPLAS18_06420 [Nitrospira sp.]
MTREMSAVRPTWNAWFTTAVRSVLAPLLFLWSGFFTGDFVLSGAYTWPRTSRIFVLTATLLILGYEFVYKAQRSDAEHQADVHARRAVLTACVLPYVAGVVLLLIIVFVVR